MQIKLKIVTMALFCSSAALAQTVKPTEEQGATTFDESAFTFTEAQLGEDDNVSQEVSVVSSNRNVYASQVGYRFSAARFKYRAFNSKYNEIYVNGNPMNDVERGEFRFSMVG